MRFLIMILLIIFALFGCEKPFDWTYEANEEKIIVVEGIITNENKKQIIELSWASSDPNKPFEAVTNATVQVEMAGSTYLFEQSNVQNGQYLSQQPFIGVVDIPIKLEVTVDNKTYTATDVMRPVTPSQKAIFKMVNNTDSLYQIVLASNSFNSTEPAMWVLDIDWSALPAYQNVPSDSCKARLFYYDLKTLDVSQVFAPGTQTLQFPKGAAVSQSKYSLSSEHVAFRRSVLLETEWRGGMFDVSPGAVYTNIKGGAVGFFGGSSVVKMLYLVD